MTENLLTLEDLVIKSRKRSY